jgi:hypothetical protein
MEIFAYYDFQVFFNLPCPDFGVQDFPVLQCIARHIIETLCDNFVIIYTETINSHQK